MKSLNPRSVTVFSFHSIPQNCSSSHYHEIPDLSPDKAALLTMTLATIPEDPEMKARRFGLERRHPPKEKTPSEITNQRWLMDKYSGTIGVPLLRWELPTEPKSIDAIATIPDNLMGDLAELLAEDRFRPKSSAWTEWFVDQRASPFQATMLIVIYQVCILRRKSISRPRERR